MAETVLLHNAVFSPQSASVMRHGAGFYEASLINYGAKLQAFDSLVEYDPIYQYDEDRNICFAPAADSIQRLDCLAMPICGTGFHNYGHFLFDGLPLVFLLKNMLPQTNITPVGPELSEWQRDILEALGLGGRYLPLQQPTMFSRLITTNLIAQHVSYPVRLLRPMVDFLRFRLAVSTGPRRRIFISRANDTSKRVMTNRGEVQATLGAMGFEIIIPEQMTFAEQVRTFATCEIVAGESGAGMANVVFCDPGTKILEIQPEHFFEGWIRATSLVMALEWNVFFAQAAPTAGPGIAFTVDTILLRQALQAVIAA